MYYVFDDGVEWTIELDIYIYIRINEFMISVVGDDDEGASSGAIDRPRRVHGRQHMLPSGAAISQPRRRPPAHRSARYA